jgi:hypothetical protein
MSAGAKEVLIKSIAQAIPTYVMGVFKLPSGLCDELTKMIRYFWWGDEGGQRKVHWLAWEKLILPKCLGGLGFRDMRLFNQALLARQAWWLIDLIHNPDSLCARLLKVKYYPNGELIDIVFPCEVSPTWRSIEHGLDLLKKGLIWHVRSGSKVRIWRDSWIPRPLSLKITMKKGTSRLRWVSQLMKPRRREWDDQVINSCMYPHDACEVLKIRHSGRDNEDFLAWHYEKSGLFIIRSAYKLALQEEQYETRQASSSAQVDGSRSLYNVVWKPNVPPEVRIFAWKLARESLATNSNRKRHHITKDATCQVCGREVESEWHAVV